MYSSKRIKSETGSPQLDIEPILGDEFTAPIMLGDAYVCQIKNKKETSKLLKFLSSQFSFERYPHLKRVRSDTKNNGDMHIIICVKEIDHDLDQNALEGTLEPYDLGPIQVVKVPIKPPLTRQQFEDCCQYWPVNFHENKSLTRVLNGSYFSSEDILQMEGHMKEAISLANKSKIKEQPPMGAIIVDPISNTVIARSHDLRHGNHPLHHAAMLCVDMVAKAQGGGMWTNIDDSDLYAADLDTLREDETRSLPYLCTGYDLFITQEPCVMCAMGLLHSRISRVFYGSSMPEGALGSKYKLHVTEGLNHHFQAFKGLLKDQCDKLYDGT